MFRIILQYVWKLFKYCMPQLVHLVTARCQHGTRVFVSAEYLAERLGAVSLTRNLQCTLRFARWVLDTYQDSFN
jgi:hypothetical protein